MNLFDNSLPSKYIEIIGEGVSVQAGFSAALRKSKPLPGNGTMKQIVIRTAVFVLLLLSIFLLFRFTALGDLADLSRIVDQRDTLLSVVENNYLLFVLAYIGVYIVVVAFSVPGATVLSISGGFFFGSLAATLFINIGATAGALLVFLAARLLLGTSIQRRYSDKLTQFNREIAQNGHSYLLTLRLIPLFPFFLVNLFAGVTSVKVRTFLWTTSLGIIPGSFVYAYLGYAGASLEPGKAQFPYEALIALVLLGLLSLIPVAVKKIRHRRKNGGYTHAEP